MGQLEKIPIGDLHLDPLNPRLPEELENAKERDVLNWMLEDASLLDLIASILHNKFFEGEPLLAVKENGKLIIVEGNRRLSAVKILNNPALVDVNKLSLQRLMDDADLNNIPTQLPVYICSNREEGANYLAFRHVSGIKPWGPRAKSRYLYKLFVNLGGANTKDIYKILAREIGSKSPYVKRLIWGYQLFSKVKANKYYSIKNIEKEEDFDFSVLTDAATKYSGIASYLKFDNQDNNPVEKVDPLRLKEVTEWLYKELNNGYPRVRSKDMGALNEVLQNSKATSIFLSMRENQLKKHMKPLHLQTIKYQTLFPR